MFPRHCVEKEILRFQMVFFGNQSNINVQLWRRATKVVAFCFIYIGYTVIDICELSIKSQILKRYENHEML